MNDKQNILIFAAIAFFAIFLMSPNFPGLFAVSGGLGGLQSSMLTLVEVVGILIVLGILLRMVK